jgi:1-pyrroline-5-carboxylate dehydrogenase
LPHRDLAGVHFTGSTGVFNRMWKTVGESMANYKSYPRLVGETGGKDFVFAHPSADADALVIALLRGAFEYQGQKCSAASRAYIPRSLWNGVRDRLVAETKQIAMGDVADFTQLHGRRDRREGVPTTACATSTHAKASKRREDPDRRRAATSPRAGSSSRP